MRSPLDASEARRAVPSPIGGRPSADRRRVEQAVEREIEAIGARLVGRADGTASPCSSGSRSIRRSIARRDRRPCGH